MAEQGPNFNSVVYSPLQVQITKEKEPTETAWRQYTAGFAAAVGILAAGAWFCWPTPLLPLLLSPDSPVPMTPEEASWMVSFIEIGSLISPLPSTFLCDHCGRKLAMLLTVPLFLVVLFLTVYVKTVVSLCVARFIAGLTMGIPYTVLPLYLGEIASPQVRGAITSIGWVFWGVGCLFPYCVGPYLSYDVLTYVTFLLNILFLFCFAWQPESPYYYALKGNLTEAEKVLRRLRDSPTDDSIERELEEIQLEVKKGAEEKASWNDIITSPTDRKALILLLIVGVISFLSGQNAMLTYSTDTFSKISNSFIPPDFVTIGIGIAALLGSVSSVFTSDRFGRRVLLIASSIGCMFSLLATSVYFYLYANTKVDLSSYSWVAPAGIMLYNWFVTAGMHSVCSTYTSELFTTKTRAIASSISNINLTLWSFVVLKTYEPMSSAIGIYSVYLFYAFTCFIGTIFFYFMMPETKGKTFLEIRESLMGSHS